MGKKKIKLHLGCGTVYKRGFINIDAFNESKADLKAKADRLPYEDNSVDLIESFHLLEHLTIKECDKTLREWFRVLKCGGKVLIEIPDLERNMKIFLNSSYKARWGKYREEFEHGRIQTIYGLGDEEGQLHKNGFDRERLNRVLKSHGFVKVKIVRKKGTPMFGENLIAVAKKPNNNYSKKSLLKNHFKSKKSPEKKNSNSFLRTFMRKMKVNIVYFLRYIADTIEELEFPF